MSLPAGSRSAAEVPELTARMARAGNLVGTRAMWVRDRLDGLWKDEDFADCYSRNGRPGLSPAQLATVSVPQFLLGLSDRDAAEAVRCRIDFKYALGLKLDGPGFHHSVLGDFRDRLIGDGLPGLPRPAGHPTPAFLASCQLTRQRPRFPTQSS
jgi:Transposase domain (DUF772)